MELAKLMGLGYNIALRGWSKPGGPVTLQLNYCRDILSREVLYGWEGSPDDTEDYMLASVRHAMREAITKLSGREQASD